ncbi:Unknown protein sequence [Pseudomonas syringae pv. cilantro]|uniref:Uncharacterized protein n=1 Tax=Pseudomonas syringae pv. cilantro TaxID=81035 RepID=A0A0N0GDW9_PSESX|nr:Unknown protein sequence [Pseudomonas syringae pv. cilantro]
MKILLDFFNGTVKLFSGCALFRISRIRQGRLEKHLNHFAKNIAFPMGVIVQPTLRIDESSADQGGEESKLKTLSIHGVVRVDSFKSSLVRRC